MEKLLYLLMAVVLFFQTGCNTKKAEESSEEEETSLIGTWELVKTLEIGHEDSTSRRNTEEKYYLKHITPTHFTWIEYDRQDDELLGAGGGTYTLVGNTYTEDIQFYYPPGSNELGQAIPFKVEFEDGLWHHTGYAKIMEFDPETGNVIVVDSAIIDELWNRTDVEPNDNQQLVGTWELASYKEPSDSIWSEYPEFVGYTRLITPTHFIWIKYSNEGDELMALGGGLYDLQEGRYIENLKYWHPSDPDYIGVQAKFNYDLENDRWKILGAVEAKDEVDELEEI